MNLRVNMWCLVVFMVGLIAACGHQEMVVLVPDPGGSVGQITVSNAAGTVSIDQANYATEVSDSTTPPTPPTLKTATEIENTFGDVLNRQPPPPVHFTFYFKSDSEQLLAKSRDKLPDIIEAIDKRMPTRVSVVGHTDTMGDKTYNLNLSMRRAVAVKDLLVSNGIDPGIIDVSSHGEENPLVKTADNVANARNRRVEVVVR